jgi:hypothetical protein
LLGGVEAVFLLQLGDESDVSLLSVLSGCAGVDFFLPGFLFGFSLFVMERGEVS